MQAKTVKWHGTSLLMITLAILVGEAVILFLLYLLLLFL
jgi:hypothetical protein